MAKAIDHVKSFGFRGGEYEVNLLAARSARIQRDLTYIADPARASRGWDAFDSLFCGNLDDYMSRIPEEDGSVGEFGCSDEAFNAFVAAATEAAGAKN